MPSPSEKLAQALDVLKKLQKKGLYTIQSSDLSRTYRERLIKNGFLLEVIKGWYVPARQDELAGESTGWYASFWDFCAAYLNKKFGHKWCLSPEQSLALHSDNWMIPPQLLVRASKGSNKIIQLPFNTSIFDARYALPDKKDIHISNQLRIYSLASALVACQPRFFIQSPTDARTALSLIRDASDVLELLLEGGHSVIAGRLAGAFRNIGRTDVATDIIKTMTAVGYSVRETDPFAEQVEPINIHIKSPTVNRMNILWQKMRKDIIKHFPKAPRKVIAPATYLKHVKEIYVTDAYHSLSIEGYRVSEELIERVRSGKWNRDRSESDKEHINALAARGYWLAYNEVEKSLQKVLKGTNPGDIFKQDHRNWYREMFSPSVSAGIIKPTDLAGYRRGQVYIRRSMHIPPSADAVRDLMPVFCQLLSEEQQSSVRIVLGHFFFVYIHPYMDGNGRIGRFLMNLMLASGGYSWLTIPVEQRSKYMSALEEASVRQNIIPFCEFLASLM